MKLRTLFAIWIVFVASLASLSASAQVYRWVDEHGRTNYSDNPPDTVKAIGGVVQNLNRISVYTPEKSLTDAVVAFRSQINASAAARRQEDERMALMRMQLAAQTAAQPSPCDSRDPYCDSGYGGYGYPYVPVAVGARRPPAHSRPQFVGGFAPRGPGRGMAAR
jgi:uncharacterized protein DUF4124